MRSPDYDLEQGQQKVVYDEILLTLPGGVHIKKDSDFDSLVVDGVLPIGTAIKKDGDDFKVIKQTNGGDEGADDTDYSDCIGLTKKDVVSEEFPFSAIVTAATVRVDALPDVEKNNFDKIKAVVPGLVGW